MITLKNGSVTTNVADAVKASYEEKLDGVLTLDFTVDGSYKPYILDDTLVACEGQYFDITSYSYSQNGEGLVIDVSCEHISYRLNEEYSSSGSSSLLTNVTAKSAMSSILAGTEFSADTSSAFNVNTTVTLKINGNMYRRNALYQLAALSGGEIYYSGYKIGLSTHRGSAAYVTILNTEDIADVDYTRDVTKDEESITLDCKKKPGLSLGDNIRVVYAPYGLDKQTRIIGLRYDPYNPADVQITVGDYVPDLNDYVTDLNGELTDDDSTLFGWYSGDVTLAADEAAALIRYKASLTGTLTEMYSYTGQSTTSADTSAAWLSAAQSDAAALNSALGYTYGGVDYITVSRSYDEYNLTYTINISQPFASIKEDIDAVASVSTWCGASVKYIEIGYIPRFVIFTTGSYVSLSDGGITDPASSSGALGISSGGFWVRNTSGASLNVLGTNYHFTAYKQTGEEQCYG